MDGAGTHKERCVCACEERRRRSGRGDAQLEGGNALVIST